MKQNRSKLQTNNCEQKFAAGRGIPVIDIIYEDNHLLAAVKPIGIPAQGDNSGKPDMLNILKLFLKQKYNKPNNVWLGLLHRLDQPVGGVMLFAKTSKAASRMSEQIRQKQWQKHYLAVVHGQLDNQGQWHDYLSSNKVQGKIVAQSPGRGKECCLNYRLLEYNSRARQSLLDIELITGRRHQIRVQSALHQHALVGDRLYGQRHTTDYMAESPALFAYKLSVKHPITGTDICVYANPKQYLRKMYPFSQFIETMNLD